MSWMVFREYSALNKTKHCRLSSCLHSSSIHMLHDYTYHIHLMGFMYNRLICILCLLPLPTAEARPRTRRIRIEAPTQHYTRRATAVVTAYLRSGVKALRHETRGRWETTNRRQRNGKIISFCNFIFDKVTLCYKKPGKRICLQSKNVFVWFEIYKLFTFFN